MVLLDTGAQIYHPFWSHMRRESWAQELLKMLKSEGKSCSYM